MTEQEFQQIFTDVRDAIIAIVNQEVDPASTVVWNREVFDENPPTWLGRITAPDGSIHCVSVCYTGTAGVDDKEDGVALETFVPMFRIVIYRGYDFGTNDDNSSDKHLNELNGLRFRFMNDPILSLPDTVCQHTGFIDQTVLSRIDTTAVHISRIDLGVELLPISYDFPS